MPATSNMLGVVIDKLTVIGRQPRNGRKLGLWHCKCICGKIVLLSTGIIKYKLSQLPELTPLGRPKSVSCGCIRSDSVRLQSGLSGLRTLINSYKQNAKNLGRKFALSEEQVRELTSSPCHYCGIKPQQRSIVSSRRTESGKQHSLYLYNGLDRIDNNAGYTMENCVPCCNRCNRAKYKYTYDEFKDWIDRLIKYQIKDPIEG